MTGYGKELILDLHDCDPERFTQETIEAWFVHVCDLTEMVPRERHFWEEHGHDEPHLNGITAVQFIETSSITIHASEANNGARINVFTCKDFDPGSVIEQTLGFFGGRVVSEHVIPRF